MTRGYLFFLVQLAAWHFFELLLVAVYLRELIGHRVVCCDELSRRPSPGLLVRPCACLVLASSSFLKTCACLVLASASKFQSRTFPCLVSVPLLQPVLTGGKSPRNLEVPLAFSTHFALLFFSLFFRKATALLSLISHMYIYLYFVSRVLPGSISAAAFSPSCALYTTQTESHKVDVARCRAVGHQSWIHHPFFLDVRRHTDCIPEDRPWVKTQKSMHER